jgi:hypothetical protein
MYRDFLFRYGAKRFRPFINTVKRTEFFGRGKCGSGVNPNLDDHLLSLVKGVSRMSVKPKLRTKRTSGSGLKFVR